MNKDANEAMLENPEGFKAAVTEMLTEANAEAAQAAERAKAERETVARNYRATQSNAGKRKDFINTGKANRNAPVLSTGITAVNELLGGGLYPGLYIIGAVSGIGKTAFILQIADEIARTRHAGNHQRDVLFFCLEMTAHELMARSVSRGTYLRARDIIPNLPKKERPTKGDPNAKYALTTRMAMNGGYTYDEARAEFLRSEEHRDAYDAGVESYFKYADGIFTVEGQGALTVDDVIKRAEDHKGITDYAPVVVVDYLQILKPTPEEEKARATDMQRITNAVLELKAWSGKSDAPVILVSSFNRDAYRKEPGMGSYMGASGIEYTADVLVSLEVAKEKDAPEPLPNGDDGGRIGITAKILKNRNELRGNNRDLVFRGAYNHYGDK